MRLHQIGVKRGRGLELRRVHLRRPILLKPRAAESVHHRRQRRKHLTPTRQAAQTDTLHTRLGAVKLGSRSSHLIPGWVVLDRYAGLVGNILAIHQKRRLTIERLAVQLPVRTLQRLRHRRENIGLIKLLIILIRLDVLQRPQPVVLRINRNLKIRQRRHIKLARLIRELLSRLITHLILRLHSKIHRNTRLLRKLTRMLLQRQHLRIIHHQHINRLISTTTTPATGTTSPSTRRSRHQQRGQTNNRRYLTIPAHLESFLPVVPLQGFEASWPFRRPIAQPQQGCGLHASIAHQRTRTHSPLPSRISDAELDQLRQTSVRGWRGRGQDRSAARPPRLMRRCDGPCIHS